MPVWLGGLLLATVVVLLSWRASSRLNERGANYPEVDPSNWAFRDFRDAVYYPVRSFLDGRNPYDTKTHVQFYPVGQHFPPYSPLTLLLHLPFGLVPFAISQWLYFAFNIALTVVLASVIWRLCVGRYDLGVTLGLAAVILLTRPGQMNLLLGQSSLILALATIGCLHFGGSRPWIAALFFALATIKPTYGGPLLLFLLARRHYRAAGLGVGITLAVTLPFLIHFVDLQGGLSNTWMILRENAQAFNANPGRDPLQSYTRIDSLCLLAKITHVVPSDWLEQVFALALAGGAAACVWIHHRRVSNSSALDGSATLAILVMLTCIYHHAYDLVVVWLPLIAATTSAGKFWPGVSKSLRTIWILVISLTMLNFLSTHTFLSVVSPRSVLWTLVTSLNGIALLAAAIVTMLAFMSFRQR